MNPSFPLFQQIIAPIEDRMIRSVWWITRNAQDAEDAMQNALMAIWKKRHRISQHPNPQALVLRICVDAACDIARRRARHRRKIEPQDLAEERVDGARLPWEELAHQELSREILTAIDQLSRRQAVAITLRVFEELPYEQIASAMNCTEATARKHVERARAHLRVVLAKHEPVRIPGAVLEQPWVHMRTVESDQSVSEEWFSPTREISAYRRPEFIMHQDFRRQEFHTYNPEDPVVYRVPEFQLPPGTNFESMAQALKVLLQGDSPPEDPLAHLGFLPFSSSDREKMTVLDQRVEKVDEPDDSWLDYRLTVDYPASDEPVRMLFRVDAVTRLPRSWRIEGQWAGKPVTRETQFDYPEKGPADIYDLGVPKTAKLVDRVPAGDIKRIDEILQSGRMRMDNYRAIFVKRIGNDYMWWTELPVILYRKGDRFRADHVACWTGHIGATERPAEDEDLGKWWKERTRFFQFFPSSVLRGATSFRSTMKTVTDPDGSQHQDIVSVEKYEYNTKPGKTFPVDYSMRPEFACRPPVGLGRQDFEPTLDPHPAEGPAGCILLSIRRTSTKNRINEKGIGVFDGHRYWLDPQRDYIVMRWDMLRHDQTGKEIIYESDRIEEAARSPQGVWFATRIRRTFESRNGKDKPLDQVYQLYIDFDADLPDSLFEPPTPRRIR